MSSDCTATVRRRAVPTAEVIDSVLADHDDVRRALDDAWQAAWDRVDPVLLELCRLRIAMLLGCEAEREARTPAAVDAGLDEETVALLARWPTSERFDAAAAGLPRLRRAVRDRRRGARRVDGRRRPRHLGDDGLADFVSALLVVEQRQRLRLTWDASAGVTGGLSASGGSRAGVRAAPRARTGARRVRRPPSCGWTASIR